MTYIKEQNLFHNSFKQVVQQGPTNAPWDHRCHIYFITFNSFPTRVILWSYSAFVKLLRLQSTAIYVWNAIKERAQPLSTDMKFPMCVIYSAYILIHLLQPNFLRLSENKQTKKPPWKKMCNWSPGQLPCWADEYDSVNTTWNNRNMDFTAVTYHRIYSHIN